VRCSGASPGAWVNSQPLQRIFLFKELIMARRRMIDPLIWEDEHFSRLSDKARILFISCISNADDDGRLLGNLSHLRAIAFRFDDISLKAIDGLVNELRENLKNFVYYPVNGCFYIQLGKWEEYQSQRDDRRKSSRLPNVNQMSTKCQPNVCVSKDKLSKDKLSKDVSKIDTQCIQKRKPKKFDFEFVWSKYPKKIGKKEAKGYFDLTIKNEEDFNNCLKAVENYKKSKSVRNGYVKNGSAFFDQWEDWMEIPESEKFCEKCKGKGSFTSTTGFVMNCDCQK